ncbi:hypothetical protein BpHYR1_016473, partial [Brachionus plicatilis]
MNKPATRRRSIFYLDSLANYWNCLYKLFIAIFFKYFTVFPCSIMQRHNLEHIIGAGAILNLAH